MSSVKAILLAAGLSSRMKRCKLDLPFKNHTIIEEVIQQLVRSDIDELIVVTGHYRSEVETLVQENNKIKLIYNPDYEQGMTTSIKKGIRSIATDAAGYIICLGDMPFIQTEDYNAILHQFSKQGDQPTIIRPFYQNKPGNPTIFSHHFKSDILKLDYMEGAKPLLKQFSDMVFQLDMKTTAIIRDIDTGEDYGSINEDP